MEKADILEMTVKHLQNVQRQQLTVAAAIDPNVVSKFKTGFSDCADEVNRYITRMDGIDGTVKQRLISHLNNCTSNVKQLNSFNFSNIFGANIVAPSLLPQQTMHPQANTQYGTSTTTFGNENNILLQSTFQLAAQDFNNNNNGNNRVLLEGLIPSRLPSGDIAYVLPNSQNLPFHKLDLNISTNRPSAFNTVITKNKVNLKTPFTTSPPLSPISSISSYDDQSNDYNQSITPPLQIHNNINMLNNAFPTPPSAELIINKKFPYQQHHITSTTLDICKNDKEKLNESILIIPNYNKKRLYVEDDDEEDCNEDHSMQDDEVMLAENERKKIKISQDDIENNNNDNLPPENPADNNMWRPW